MSMLEVSVSECQFGPMRLNGTTLNELTCVAQIHFSLDITWSVFDQFYPET